MHGERQAGIDPPAVDEDRAGAALAVVAALLGAGQAQVLAQRVEQRRARIDLQAVLLAIDRQRHLGVHGALDTRLGRAAGRRGDRAALLGPYWLLLDSGDAGCAKHDLAPVHVRNVWGTSEASIDQARKSERERGNRSLDPFQTEM